MDWEMLFLRRGRFLSGGGVVLAAAVGGRTTASQPKRRLAASEISTILIAVHQGNFRNLKHFYRILGVSHSADVPELVS